MLGEHHPSLDREFALGPLLASTGFAANMTPLFNTEHSVPQSWFDKQQPMRADLHALFTAEPGCNTNRSNLPFGENGDTSGADCGLRRGNSFEPARNKGAVARATFYFLSRYPGVVSARDLPPESLAVLLKWHEDEPPSLWEKHRNQEIAKIQGNRNPFIDRPEWARSIDFTLGLSR
ncbi:MAG: endonuclease [Myxococcota bacterium]